MTSIAVPNDGINATCGTVNGGTESNDGSQLYISGGIAIVTGSDGIDSNGNMVMTAGVVIVNGPTTNNNGPIHYGGTFQMTGGFLVAVGSSGMAQAPTASISTQKSARLTSSTTQAVGTMIHIESTTGQTILTFVPTKAYQSIVISSPLLTTGTYRLYSGGSSTGSVMDGLYSNGIYIPDTLVRTFIVT